MELPEIKEEIESYECCGLICRLCLSEESLEDVFKDGFFHEWISDFLSIKITTNDRLSQAICAICRIRLADFHQYRIRCHEVQGVLQALADGTPMGTDVALAVDPNAVNQLQPIVEKKDPLIQCELCQKVFKDETELKNHKSIHAPEIVLCASCGELFETREQLYKHLESQTTGCDVNQTDSLVHANQVDEVDSASEPLAPQAQKVESKVESKSKVSSEIVQLDSDSENSTKESSDKSLAQKNGSKSLTSTAIVKIDSDSENSGVECLSLDQGTRPKSRTSIEDSDIKNSEPESEQDPLCFDPCKEDVSAADKLDVEMEVDEGEDKFEDENMDAKDEKYSSDDSSISPSKAVRNKKKRNVNGSRDHECRVCDKQLSSCAVLRKHLRTHQSPEERQRAKPPSDGKPLPRPFKCEFCPNTYVTHAALWTHTQVKHKNNTYECEICGYQFPLRELLNRHMKTHTAREHTKEDFQVLRKLAPKKDKVTNRKNNNADGTKKNESGSKNRKTNKPTNVGTKKCAKPSTELPFPCDICEQSFETLVLLYRHKRYLHKPKRFKCPVCDKCFAYRKQRNMHMRGHDKLQSDTIKDFECDECHKIYPTWKALYAHVTIGHIKRKSLSEERTVPCPKCNKMFQTQTQKDLHFRVVHASVEYKCHICDIVFPIRVKLWEHMTHRHENQPTISSASKPDESVGSVEQSGQKDVDRDDQPTESETAQKAGGRKQPQRNVKTRSDAKRRRE
nr:zinc finger protein Xfin-like isoform X2 [Aedes albopictus]